MSGNWQGRDKRSKGWFWLDNDYLNGYAKVFGAVGTAVYVSLCRHANNETQECFPAMETIAEELNISRDTVSKYIKLFEISGLIEVKRERNSATKKWLNNTYLLLDKSRWKSHAEITRMDSHAEITGKSHAEPFRNKETQNTKETHLSAKAEKKVIHLSPEGEEGGKYSREAHELSRLICAVDPKNKLTLFSNSHLKTADFLISEYGYEKVKKVIENLPLINKQMLYIAQITNFFELRNNFMKLMNVLEQRRQVKNNNKLIV